jgi:hypothetical protein
MIRNSSILICIVDGKPQYYVNGVHVHDGTKFILGVGQIANCELTQLDIISALDKFMQIMHHDPTKDRLFIPDYSI